MGSIKINLNLASKVSTLVSILTVLDSDFDLVSDRYTVDAKSIMGIFSLDLSRPVKLVVYDTNAVEVNDLAKALVEAGIEVIN